MTQEQFNLICTIIRNGAPALAGDLLQAMHNLANNYNQVKSELDARIKAESEIASKKVKTATKVVQ